MGWNEIHDDISLYSLSWLQGGKMVKDGFSFPNGAKWFISFWDEEIGKSIEEIVLKKPEVCYGMKVEKIKEQHNPEFGSIYYFKLGSPFLAREKLSDGKIKHLRYNDVKVDENLTKTLMHKLDKANLKSVNIKVSIDRNYLSPKTKLVTIKGIKNRANYCPVIICGDPITLQFAWCVGIGNSTGSTFGTLL
jgi:CRISPR-associated endoribonuclease Cas6